jgi:ABC-type uncharacterized transport system permease subunit
MTMSVGGLGSIGTATMPSHTDMLCGLLDSWALHRRGVPDDVRKSSIAFTGSSHKQLPVTTLQTFKDIIMWFPLET